MSTPRSFAQRLPATFRAAGVKPEWEVFNHAHLLADMPSLTEFDRAPFVVNFVLNQQRRSRMRCPTHRESCAGLTPTMRHDTLILCQ